MYRRLVCGAGMLLSLVAALAVADVDAWGDLWGFVSLAGPDDELAGFVFVMGAAVSWFATLGRTP